MLRAVTSTQPPAVLGLLSDPLRWQIVRELGSSDRRVGELVAIVDKPQNVVSYHLAELRKAGLASSRRSSADGRDVYYRLDLHRCHQLLADAGSGLHPGLALAPVAPPWAHPRRRAPKVLFLCTGNSARSQMAEALLEHRSAHTITARSAGSNPKSLHPHAVAVMAARGIDISANETKHVDRFAHMRFDRIVTLCDKVREVCPRHPASPDATMSHWSMADPTEDGSRAAFERAADEIEARIELLIAELNT